MMKPSSNSRPGGNSNAGQQYVSRAAICPPGGNMSAGRPYVRRVAISPSDGNISAGRQYLSAGRHNDEA
eukprot:2647738-Prymnesium_polylepis.1